MMSGPPRADGSTLHPIEHGSQEAQQDMLQLKLRDSLVRARVVLINAVRFTLKKLGIPGEEARSGGSCRSPLRGTCWNRRNAVRQIEPELGGNHAFRNCTTSSKVLGAGIKHTNPRGEVTRHAILFQLNRHRRQFLERSVHAAHL